MAKVLLVDDMQPVRQALRGMLEAMKLSSPVQVQDASDGDVAWDLIRESLQNGSAPFDLVVADWKMRGMTGVDLLRAVRGVPELRNLPFIMVTAEADRSRLSEAMDSGANGYLVKPFSIQEFQALVSNWLK